MAESDGLSHRAACSEVWGDPAWWADLLEQALTTADPVLANLRITLAHYQLSLALRALLGPEAGANFHTWATWGSRKAGTTIRRADVPGLPALALLAGGALGLLGPAALRLGRRDVPDCAFLLGPLLGGLSLRRLTRQRLIMASRLILAGNRTVLADIGAQTARFATTFHGRTTADPARLEAFLAALRPGSPWAGGQALLRHAFTHYYQSRYAPDRSAQQEEALLGNLYAILHEHVRLQPYIAGAMPEWARRLITRRLLHFAAGRRRMSVSQDVPPWVGGTAALSPVAGAELRAFLAGAGGWNDQGYGWTASRASNWAKLRERMHYICALFRAGHGDSDLFAAPYTAAQRAEIAAGRIPRSLR